MKLTISDRLNLGMLYPQKSNIVDQILVKDIQDKIEITQEESKTIGLKIISKSYTWKKESDLEKEFKFSKTEINFLQDRVKDLDAKKEITQQVIDLCLKIKEFKTK